MGPAIGSMISVKELNGGNDLLNLKSLNQVCIYFPQGELKLTNGIIRIHHRYNSQTRYLPYFTNIQSASTQIIIYNKKSYLSPLNLSITFQMKAEYSDTSK